jgi:hypothetical protein
MAICKYCQQEMHTAEGCIKMAVPTIDGPFDPIPYGGEIQHLKEPPAPGQYHHEVLIGDPPRCHDCSALPGFYHHVGCDWEECPRCHGQEISCDCHPETEAEKKEVLQ